MTMHLEKFHELTRALIRETEHHPMPVPSVYGPTADENPFAGS